MAALISFKDPFTYSQAKAPWSHTGISACHHMDHRSRYAAASYKPKTDASEIYLDTCYLSLPWNHETSETNEVNGRAVILDVSEDLGNYLRYLLPVHAVSNSGGSSKTSYTINLHFKTVRSPVITRKRQRLAEMASSLIAENIVEMNPDNGSDLTKSQSLRNYRQSLKIILGCKGRKRKTVDLRDSLINHFFSDAFSDCPRQYRHTPTNPYP
ncbi:hypothetical protein ACTXT7_014486 [Hymenolepis weldensis]